MTSPLQLLVTPTSCAAGRGLCVGVERSCSYAALRERLEAELGEEAVGALRCGTSELPIDSEQEWAAVVAAYDVKRGAAPLCLALAPCGGGQAPGSGTLGFSTTLGTPHENWTQHALIARGSSGSVYLGQGADGGWLAVKVLDLADSQQNPERAMQELEMLSTLAHPNLVRYLGAEADRDSKRLYLHLEYLAGGTLTQCTPLSPEKTSNYTHQLLLALEYLHQQRVIHRDVKGSNCLLDGPGVVLKLADFGVSKLGSHGVSVVGTPCWMAPEVLSGKTYDESVDVWSTGCTVVEMLSCRPPWPEFASPFQALAHISEHDPELPPMPTNARDIVVWCLERCPADRPSATQLLRHPFASGAC